MRWDWDKWHNKGYIGYNLLANSMWSTTHFPAAMRSLSPSTRAKAIEIANKLLEQGQLDKQSIVTVSVSEARQWARNTHTSQEWPSRTTQPYA